MSELFFPVVGAMLTLFVVVPLFTLIASALTHAFRRSEGTLAAYDRPWRLLLIVGPSLGPLVWLISATIHQSEDNAPLAACVIDHLGGELCRDVVFFGLILFAVLGCGVIKRLRRERHLLRECADNTTKIAVATQRLSHLCRQDPRLTSSLQRIRIVERPSAPACSRGLLRSWVELDADLVDGLSREELVATILHELEHALARDPLRLFLAQVALSINPLGRLLAPELARYHFSREALCDKRAVQRGADPLALARSIVSVATPTPRPLQVPSLGGHGIQGVRVRVQLLLGYAAHCPGPARPRMPVGMMTALIALLALWPHVLGTGLLDELHRGIEQAALMFGLH